MTYPIRQPPDNDTAWGSDVRAVVAGVNDHQTRVTSLESLAVTSSTVDTIVTITQAAYDALSPKDSRTLYLITG